MFRLLFATYGIAPRGLDQADPTSYLGTIGHHPMQHDAVPGRAWIGVAVQDDAQRMRPGRRALRCATGRCRSSGRESTRRCVPPCVRRAARRPVRRRGRADRPRHPGSAERHFRNRAGDLAPLSDHLGPIRAARLVGPCRRSMSTRRRSPGSARSGTPGSHCSSGGADGVCIGTSIRSPSTRPPAVFTTASARVIVDRDDVVERVRRCSRTSFRRSPGSPTSTPPGSSSSPASRRARRRRSMGCSRNPARSAS